MFEVLYYWIDIIWLPIIFLSVHKKHRWWALGFAVSSLIITHLLIETMVFIGYENGIAGLLTSHVKIRSLVVSSVYYTIFLLMARYSKNTEGVVFMAACLSFFFMIFVTTSIVMVL